MPSQRAVCGGDEYDPVRLVQGFNPMRMEEALVQKKYQIQFVAVHPLQQKIRAVSADGDGNLRVETVILSDQSRKDGSADRFDGTDAQLACKHIGFL